MDFFLKTEWILNVFGAAGIGTETSGDLPPSYSLLDIEPPDYDDISIL